MADDTPPAALDRIDHAIARIEAALATRSQETARALRRHATLRASMQEAVAALDAVMSLEADA